MKNTLIAPKFQAGDVVEATAKGWYAVKGAKGKITRITKTKSKDISNHMHIILPKEIYVYDFESFENPNFREWGLDFGFEVCKGISEKQLCVSCDSCYKCPNSSLVTMCQTNGAVDEEQTKQHRLFGVASSAGL